MILFSIFMSMVSWACWLLALLAFGSALVSCSVILGLHLSLLVWFFRSDTTRADNPRSAWWS